MQILKFTIKTAKQAGKLILNETKKPLHVWEKSKGDLVTNADKKSEKFIIEKIKKNFPSHAILAEENSFTHPGHKEKFFNSEYIWIIDPLDGTTNFAHHLPLFAVSIALFKKTSSKSGYLEGEVIAGVVYAPVLGELFYAEKGKGAFLNGKKIKVSKTKKLEKSFIVTGITPEQKEKNLPYIVEMVRSSQALRRLGAATIDLCYVACGRFDAHWEFGLHAWDVAAAALILQEAGGKVTDTKGGLLDLTAGDILATNGNIHNEMRRHLIPCARSSVG